MDASLASLTSRLSANQLEGVAGKVVQVEFSVQELEATFESKIREFSATVYAAQAGQAGGSSGFEGQGFSSATPQTRDRNVFDP